MNNSHKDVRPFEDFFAIHCIKKQIAKQETSNAEEYSQIYRGNVDGGPKDILI
jgi:hypothetical protein